MKAFVHVIRPDIVVVNTADKQNRAHCTFKSNNYRQGSIYLPDRQLPNSPCLLPILSPDHASLAFPLKNRNFIS